MTIKINITLIMRNLLKITAVVLLIVASAATNAQTLKFGHIDLEALIQVMPESAAAQTELENLQRELEEVLLELSEEFQQKLTEYEQLGDDVSEIRRNAKITEIQELNTRSDNFRNNAVQQIDYKRAELLQPILEKAENAIEEVARAQSLVYVFDSNYLYYKSNVSIDILPLVKERLGIK